MNDREFGRLESKVDHLVEAVEDIREAMVTRREFEAAKAEHAPLSTRLAALELENAREATVKLWVNRVFWAVAAAGTAALIKLNIGA